MSKKNLIYTDQKGRRRYRRFRTLTRKVDQQALADWLGCFPRESESDGILAIDRLLPSLVESLNSSSNELSQAQLSDAWHRAAGDFLAQQAQLVSLRKGIATVRILQPAVLFYLRQNKFALLEKLQSQLGKENVSDIAFQQG